MKSWVLHSGIERKPLGDVVRGTVADVCDQRPASGSMQGEYTSVVYPQVRRITAVCLAMEQAGSGVGPRELCEKPAAIKVADKNWGHVLSK